MTEMVCKHKAIAFDVQIKEAVNPNHPISKRLGKQKKRKTTAEEIAEKLWNAEQRRKALLNMNLCASWHLLYDRRKSVNNAVSYDVCIDHVEPSKENEEKMMQEEREQKLRQLDEKQRIAQQRRKAFIKQRCQRRQRAQIVRTQSSDDYVCYEVSFEDKEIAESKVPAFVSSPRRRQNLTMEHLQEKQRRAEERRKQIEEARVAKARQLEQETLKFNHAVSCLVGRQSSEGAESLSRREVSEHMKTVVIGLGKLKASMERDLELGKRFHDLTAELQKDAQSKEEIFGSIHNHHAPEFLRAQTARRAEKRHRVASGGNSVAFQVSFEETENIKPAALPQHLAKRLNARRTVTAQEISDKQKQAANRKKAHEQAKLERVRKAEEDCRVMDKATKDLLDHYSGAAPSQPLSQQQVKQHLRTVARGFSEIQHSLAKNIEEAQNLEK